MKKTTLTETAPDGFSYVPGFLTEDEQQALLIMLAGLDYKQDTFRGQKLKRRYAQFGYAYISIGRKVESAPPLPDFLTALMERVMPRCPAGTSFNQCIVTHYPVGAGIGWHPDADVFGDCIVAVSLGAPARLQFGPKGTKEASYEVLATPRSLYIMRGRARWQYQHQVVAVKAERYSITFREVKKHKDDTTEL